jgi:acetoin utilization deacetylase AcuC-like enzyme
MKLVFDEKYFDVYDTDPAAEAGRLEPTYERVKTDPFYEIVKPLPAIEEDILRAHTRSHYEQIKRQTMVYPMAMLAAGGAIKSAQLAYDGFPTFGLIRPPGHHASADSCWGFCSFNNISIALLRLYAEKKIKSAFVLDFDLHTGDGNINILGQHPELPSKILNPHARNEKYYLDEVHDTFESLEKEKVDIICASAGFDDAIGDWGNTLSTLAYNKLGLMMKEYSEKLCKGRRFALLEGGYNFKLMPVNFNSFCQGFGK